MDWTADKNRGHPEPADLHALARSECTREQTVELQNHLQSCSYCAQRYAWIQDGLELLSRPSEPDFNELQWQAIENRLVNRLREEEQPSIFPWKLRPYLPAFSVGCVAMALALLFVASREVPVDTTSTSQESRPLTAANRAAPSADKERQTSIVTQNMKVADRVFQVTGTAPYQFNKNDSSTNTILFFQVGDLHVRETIENDRSVQSLGLRTEGFSAIARSRDFRVNSLADRVSIQVDDGEIEVQTPQSSAKTIKVGQRADINLVQNKNSAKNKGFIPDSMTESSDRSKGEALRETQVEVIPPSMEAAAESSGLNGLTVELAKRWLVEYPSGGSRHREALRYLCDAYIEQQKGVSARKYCENLLQEVTEPTRRYELNRKLGFIHKELLNDCSPAIAYFSKALAAGNKSTIFSDPIRFARAECALQDGQLELAKIDLNALQRNKESVIRNSDLNRLLQILQTGHNKAGKSR